MRTWLYRRRRSNPKRILFRRNAESRKVFLNGHRATHTSSSAQIPAHFQVFLATRDSFWNCLLRKVFHEAFGIHVSKNVWSRSALSVHVWIEQPVQIPFISRSHPVHIPFTSCSRPFRFCSRTVHVLFRYCSRTVHVLFTYCSRTVQDCSIVAVDATSGLFNSRSSFIQSCSSIYSIPVQYFICSTSIHPLFNSYSIFLLFNRCSIYIQLCSTIIVGALSGLFNFCSIIE